MEEIKQKSGKEQYISFLKKKLELSISWAWNGVTPQENLDYQRALEEVSECIDAVKTSELPYDKGTGQLKMFQYVEVKK